MRQAFRAAVLHCLADPGEGSDASALQFFDDGLLLVEDGRVLDIGDASTLLQQLSDDIERSVLVEEMLIPHRKFHRKFLTR